MFTPSSLEKSTSPLLPESKNVNIPKINRDNTIEKIHAFLKVCDLFIWLTDSFIMTRQYFFKGKFTLKNTPTWLISVKITGFSHLSIEPN